MMLRLDHQLRALFAAAIATVRLATSLILRQALRILIVTLLIGAFANGAAADKRIALLVGNSKYQHARELSNPSNDVAALARMLRNIGFEVTDRVDLNYRQFRDEVRRFSIEASSADMVLIHFAGHGVEVAGENYLLPVDAALARDVDLEYEALTLTSLLDATIGARHLRMVILDACRNNPFTAKMKLSTGSTRSVSRGLAPVEPEGEVLVAFSAKAGTLALDGSGLLSPFAEALVKHLAVPGRDVRLSLGSVRNQVLAATEGSQEPFIYGSLGGDVVSLVPPTDQASEPDHDAMMRAINEAVAKAKAEEAEAKRQAEDALRKRQEAEAETTRLRQEAEQAKEDAKRHRQEMEKQVATADLQTSVDLRPSKSKEDVGLKLCNTTNSKVGVAIGYKTKTGWVSEGWWNIGAQSCKPLLGSGLDARYYYVFAVDYDKGGSWGGRNMLCTRDKVFTIQGIGNCAERGFNKTGFFEVDTGDERNWTVTLK